MICFWKRGGSRLRIVRSSRQMVLIITQRQYGFRYLTRRRKTFIIPGKNPLVCVKREA
jgi:hypothetical protein